MTLEGLVREGAREILLLLLWLLLLPCCWAAAGLLLGCRKVGLLGLAAAASAAVTTGLLPSSFGC